MKLILLFTVITITAFCEPSDTLLDAISIVESNNNPNAVGDNGNAIGCYQIWPLYMRDVIRISRKVYMYADRLDPEKSREMVKIYLTHYGKVYKRKTGLEPTDEIYSRIHNGGPNGYKKEATKKYWLKVQNIMAKSF